MGGFNSVKEILEFAIAKEVEANKFYTVLADRVANPAMSELILQFAKEELEHKAKLELELMKAGRVVAKAEKLADFDINDYILVDAGDTARMDYGDLLLAAMEKEKASFKLYVVLAGMAEDEDSQQVLVSLAEEEARHKMLFEIEYDEMVPKPT